MTCDCEDWEPGNEELNKHMGLWTTHFGSFAGAEYYKYKKFVYCPWCGKKLKKEKEDD